MTLTASKHTKDLDMDNLTYPLGNVEERVDGRRKTLERVDFMNSQGFTYLPTLKLANGYQFAPIPLPQPRPRLQLAWDDEVAGLGVRTLDRIPKHSVIMEFGGKERVDGDAGVQGEWAYETLHATNCGNLARFVNCRCKNGNVQVFSRKWEGAKRKRPKGHEKRLFLQSLYRDILPGSFLNMNYGAGYPYIKLCVCGENGPRPHKPRGAPQFRDSKGRITQRSTKPHPSKPSHMAGGGFIKKQT